jgi:hypothetical protein
MRKRHIITIVVMLLLLAPLILLTHNSALAQVPPSVVTNFAVNVTSDSATLNCNISNLGDASTVSVSFEWGLTTSYGNETPSGTMTDIGPFSANLSGLNPGRTYHFRAKAVGNGTSYGYDMTFTTIMPLSLQGWGWCTSYNKVVSITFDGNATMLERTGAPNSFSLHVLGNLTLPSPYDEKVPLDLYGSRVRSLIYLRQEVTGESVTLYGTWLPNGNQTYISMTGLVALPNPEGQVFKTASVCFVTLRTPDVEVALAQPGSFVQDLDSMLTRFIKFIDHTLSSLIGTGFSGILSNILAKISVLLAHLRAVGTPYIP